MGLPKTSDCIQIKIQIPNPSQEPPASYKAPNQDLKDMRFFAPSKSSQSAKIHILDVSKPNDHIQIKMKMPTPNQEPPVSSKAPNEDLRTWMFFATSKSRYRAKIRIMGISKTSDHIKIKIKIPNPSQEPPASSKAPNEDLKDMDVLCTFKIKIESQNLDHGCIKDQ